MTRSYLLFPLALALGCPRRPAPAPGEVCVAVPITGGDAFLLPLEGGSLALVTHIGELFDEGANAGEDVWDVVLYAIDPRGRLSGPGRLVRPLAEVVQAAAPGPDGTVILAESTYARREPHGYAVYDARVERLRLDGGAAWVNTYGVAGTSETPEALAVIGDRVVVTSHGRRVYGDPVDQDVRGLSLADGAEVWAWRDPDSDAFDSGVAALGPDAVVYLVATPEAQEDVRRVRFDAASGAIRADAIDQQPGEDVLWDVAPFAGGELIQVRRSGTPTFELVREDALVWSKPVPQPAEGWSAVSAYVEGPAGELLAFGYTGQSGQPLQAALWRIGADGAIAGPTALPLPGEILAAARLRDGRYALWSRAERAVEGGVVWIGRDPTSPACP